MLFTYVVAGLGRPELVWRKVLHVTVPTDPEKRRSSGLSASWCCTRRCRSSTSTRRPSCVPSPVSSALARAHPHVVPLLVTRPLATPLALRPLDTLRQLEAILELLIRAGFSDVDALHVYRSFYGFIQGHMLNELQELLENHEETDDLLRLGLHRLPLREFPRLRSLAPVLAAYDGAAELEQGVDILLAGLQRQIRPSGPPRS